jgi:hypothetical protein
MDHLATSDETKKVEKYTQILVCVAKDTKIVRISPTKEQHNFSIVSKKKRSFKR